MNVESTSRCAAFVAVLLVTGCRPTPQAAPQPPAPSQPSAPPPAAAAPGTDGVGVRLRSSPFFEAATTETKSQQPGTAQQRPAQELLPKPQIDEQKAAAAGIRKLQSRHLVLYTDVPSRPEIDGLCELADQAYPQWCDYFQVAPAEQPAWQMTGYLMRDERRFQAAGLLPENLPEFLNGFCRDQEFWLYDQKADYYRRHLLLHEMTHGFMYTRLRTGAPPWYLEGIAELLATHRLADGKLEMNYFPRRKEETPDWGRIKLVEEGFAKGDAPFFKQVLALPPEAHLKVENYAWCWAAAALLDGHPRYRQRFRQVARELAQPEFDERFRQMYAEDWLDLAEEWQLFVGWMEYGYDLQRAAADFQPGEPLPAGGAKITLAADRGWQSTRLRLEVGKPYRLRAAGRFEVAQEPQPWISEAGGVSIRYYKKAPLGILCAAVRPELRDEDSVSSFFRAEFIGLEQTIRPAETGTLYLRINDSNAELSDNRGELQVEVLSAEGE
jgi:hypothetical protein